VGCVQCHIGPGAGWFVRSKLSGVRQVFAVALGTYSRPIPSPVHELRPAQDTCEQCHWPEKFVGDKFLIKRKYADDEANTPLYSVLALKVGGRQGQKAAGIHGAHLGESGRVSYVTTDGRRQIIPIVRYRDDKGEVVEYVSEDVKVTPEEIAKGESRAMDCIDCHNRPTHAFDLPERAMDRAFAESHLSRELPFLKKKGVELLRAEYPDQETAERKNHQGLADYYKESHPEAYRVHRGQVEAASSTLVGIYKRNVFPAMKVTWGTHPNHIGHEDSPGCFRCHDESHKAKDGRVIKQDCETCHAILAQEDPAPAILKEIGVTH
jgi:hypothetical protein